MVRAYGSQSGIATFFTTEYAKGIPLGKSVATKSTEATPL